MDRVEELINQVKAISPLPHDSALTEAWLSKYEAILSEFAVWRDPRCIDPLIGSFGYGEGHGVYWSVIHLLEQFDESQVDPLLIHYLQAGLPGPCMWAAFMLGRSRNRSAVPFLLSLLKRDEVLVRQYAVMALGMIGDNRAVPQLQRLRSDPASVVRQEVEAALRSLASGFRQN